MQGATAATFEPLVGSDFELLTPSPVKLTLTQVTRGADHGPQAPREPFALLFHGPPEPGLEQRTYPTSHAQLGSFDLFIVAVGRDAQAMHYEAVFA